VRLSLYVHIPFCHRLCWYCGCNTKATQRYAPVGGYLSPVESEIAGVASLLPGRHSVAHMHWGGGSPNILTAGDIGKIASALRNAFIIERRAEFAVEIDPRHMDGEKIRRSSSSTLTASPSSATRACPSAPNING
jgi:oxygen-independent coproporphyrinogen-3 oxidase